MHHGAIECIPRASKVPAIGKDDRNSSEDPNLALRAGIPQPPLGTEQTRRVSNRPGVKKRAKLHGEDAIPINVLVQFPVGQKELSPEWRGALSSVRRAAVSAEPEIIVAFDTQLKKLVESDLSRSRARTNLEMHLIVISLGFGKPAGAE